MASTAFLETLATYCLTLASLIAALVTVVPILLPKAFEKVDHKLAEVKTEGAWRKSEARTGIAWRIKRAFLVSQVDYLTDLRDSLKTVMRAGFIAAGSYFVCSLIALSSLTANYDVVDGVAYVLLDPALRAAILVSFALGVIMTAVTVVSFYDLASVAAGIPLKLPPKEIPPSHQ